MNAHLMTPDLGAMARHAVFGAFLLFCRIGGCLMLAPGLSNAQFPVQVRLFVAIAVSLSLSPILIGEFHVAADALEPTALARLIVAEALIGVMIGILSRAFFSALETIASASAQFLGFNNPFGVSLDHDAAAPPLASLATIAAVALLFASDMHLELIRALVGSYRAIPLAADFDAAFTLRRLLETLASSFLVAARVASPFFIYSVVVNFAFALINRVTPQISVFYVAPPFVAGGGMVLLYFVIKGELSQFMAAFAAWLRWS